MVTGLLCALLAASASAQFLGGTSNSVLCNKTFDDANATGIFSFNPDVPQGQQANQPDNNSGQTRPAAWAVTLAEGSAGSANSTTEYGVWYNTNGANYSDNVNLWYDVCVVSLTTITTNTNLRGQTDNGSCIQTFDEQCVSDLKDQSENYAMQLVSSPTPAPNSNLTQDSLPTVCYDLGNMMSAGFPSSCSKYFNGTGQGNGGPLTSYNHSILYNGCDLTATSNATYHYGTSLSYLNENDQRQQAIYANLSHLVIPVLTVFLPIADSDRQKYITNAVSELSCLHIEQFNPGSEKPPAAASPTPIGGGGLSGGAIAGIVVGCVAFVALVAAGALFFLRRRKRSNKAKAGDDAPPPPAYTDHKNSHGTPIAEAPAHTAMSELPPSNVLRPELPTQNSGPRIELPDNSKMRPETGATPTAELEATMPAHRDQR